MKKPKTKKIIINSILAAAFTILLFLCFLAYIWRPYGRKMYLVGRNDTTALVINQVQRDGQVPIDTPKGRIILVPKQTKNEQ